MKIKVEIELDVPNTKNMSDESIIDSTSAAILTVLSEYHAMMAFKAALEVATRPECQTLINYHDTWIDILDAAKFKVSIV